ncbi:MAG: hypothetical protein FWE21_09390 [Defluviitaleaceae bacterium]|nr:hypothetical protein [Defluviitaleaceae bacterium]
MLVKINDKFIHVADEVMLTNDGKPLLPGLEGRHVLQRQLDSWNYMKGYCKPEITIICGHGPVMEGGKLEKDLQNRIEYAKAIMEANGAISYEDATKNCHCDFVGKPWHDHFAR